MLDDRVVVTCEPLREVLSLVEPTPAQVLLVDRNFHRSPDRLREHLQGLINENRDATMVLAIGLCGEATVGLKASGGTLVLPRVDDCLALLMGSQEAYREQARQCPGTYYLSKGWLESGDDVVSDFDRCVERYGPDRTARIFQSLLRHYRQVVFIRTGVPGEESQLSRAAAFAERFGLALRVVPGDLSLMSDLIHNRESRHVIRVPGGGRTTVADFLPGVAGFGTAVRASSPAVRLDRQARALRGASR